MSQPCEHNEQSADSDCCGAKCWASRGNHGKCRGRVTVIDSAGDDPDGGELWVHSCDAHSEVWFDMQR